MDEWSSWEMGVADGNNHTKKWYELLDFGGVKTSRKTGSPEQTSLYLKLDVPFAKVTSCTIPNLRTGSLTTFPTHQMSSVDTRSIPKLNRLHRYTQPDQNIQNDAPIRNGQVGL